MKTANEVIERIDEELEQMEAAAAGPCIDLVTDHVDRDAYRDALKRAFGLQAVRQLRERLAREIDERPATTRKRAPRRSTKRTAKRATSRRRKS